MNGIISPKDVCEKVWSLEKDTNLLCKEIYGVKIWQLLRFQIFNQIVYSLGIYGQAHTLKQSFIDKVKALPLYLYNSITKNPLWGKYTKEILIFDHPRKLKIDGFYQDIYTQSLLEQLNEEKYDVIEMDCLRKHWTDRKIKNRKYYDYYYINTLFQRYKLNIKFNEEELTFIRQLEDKIRELFGLKFNLEELCREAIKAFKLQYNFYNKILKKRKPKQIYIVVSYGQQPLIAAAKDNNIKVIELQHGVITPYHLGYNFPYYTEEIKYFPDELYVFGEYWKNSANYPISKEKIYVYGFPYMQRNLEKYKSVKKINKQILVLSQGTIGNKLSTFVYKLALELEDYKFIYKLHPGEYDRWKSSYHDLVKASMLNNFEVIDNNDKELYRYLAESEIQIGVYSTAIFEGLVLGCKTLLVNLPGVEYMEHLIRQKLAVLASNKIERVKHQIKELTSVSFDPNYFFAGIHKSFESK